MSIRRLSPVLIGILTPALAGCATLPAPAATALPPALTQLLDLPLPPSSFGRSATLDQLVTGKVAARDVTLRFRVEVSPGALVLAGLNPVGIPLFSLRNDGQRVQVSTLGGQSLPIDPKVILADFQLAFWPAAALAPALATRGLRLEDDAAGTRRRIMSADGQTIVNVSYAMGSDGQRSVRLDHVTPLYSLQIRSTEAGN